MIVPGCESQTKGEKVGAKAATLIGRRWKRRLRWGSEPKEFGPQMDADRTRMKGTIRRKIEREWWRLDLLVVWCLIDARFLSALDAQTEIG